MESRLIGDSGMNALGEAYAASVAQQPRVANQVYQTMTDINTFASEVTEIQEQKKPIRIFYSETSAITMKVIWKINTICIRICSQWFSNWVCYTKHY